MSYTVEKSDAEWKALLAEKGAERGAYEVTRHAALPRDEARVAAKAMRAANPKFVLRNHLGQEAIEKAEQKDFSGVATLLSLLESPFEDHPGHDTFAGFPPDWASTIEISCSS